MPIVLISYYFIVSFSPPPTSHYHCNKQNYMKNLIFSLCINNWYELTTSICMPKCCDLNVVVCLRMITTCEWVCQTYRPGMQIENIKLHSIFAEHFHNKYFNVYCTMIISIWMAPYTYALNDMRKWLGSVEEGRFNMLDACN